MIVKYNIPIAESPSLFRRDEKDDDEAGADDDLDNDAPIFCKR